VKIVSRETISQNADNKKRMNKKQKQSGKE
jgi:hypothetical protein